MSETASPVAQDETSALPRPPLDELMLAMDVVDTLRHQRVLVAAELGEEERDRVFAERVKEIYASQGIDVPDEVIAEGVEALKRDRFTYDPPEKSFQLRLAHLYVDRGIWARRLLVVLLIGAVIFGAIAWSHHRKDRALVEGFTARTTEIRGELQEAEARTDAAHARLADARRAAGGSSTVSVLLDRAEGQIEEARRRVSALRIGWDADPLDPEAYPDRVVPFDEALQARRHELTQVREGLDGAERRLDAADRLRAVVARTAGLVLSGAEQAEVDLLRTQAEEALVADDTETAERRLWSLSSLISRWMQEQDERLRIEAGLRAAAARRVGLDTDAATTSELDQHVRRIQADLEARSLSEATAELRALDALLDTLVRTYELRIVSRPDVQSGVWRTNAQGARNHYLIVEAVGPDGRALPLPIRSEEDGATRTVTQFGVRVSPEVYERVKQDKLDNGIVENTLVAVKRRGVREPEFRMQVMPGRITRW